MQAVIMAGGTGSRLEPITCAVPKPLVPVANVPVLAHVIRFLAGCGVRNIHLTLHHLAERVSAYISSQALSPASGEEVGAGRNQRWLWGADTSPWGAVTVTCWEETVPRGTAGSVRALGAALSPGPILVASGDVVTDARIAPVAAFHKARRALVTIVAKVVSDPKGLGILTVSAGGRVVGFVEKPGRLEGHAFLVNTGTYLMEPEALDLIPEGAAFDFSRDVFPTMLEAGLPLYAYVTRCYWVDVGTPHAYLRANVDACMGASPAKGVGERVRPLGLVGAGTSLGSGVRLAQGAVVGGGCEVQEGAELDAAVVWDGTIIGAHTLLGRCIVGSGCRVGPRARIMPGAIVAERCVIGEGALIGPGARVWPGCTVPAGEVVHGDYGGVLRCDGARGDA